MNNELKAKLLLAICGIICFIALWGWAGNIDYCDQVILSMPQEEYDSVRNHLIAETGDEPSESDIAHYYMEHQE